MRSIGMKKMYKITKTWPNIIAWEGKMTRTCRRELLFRSCAGEHKTICAMYLLCGVGKSCTSKQGNIQIRREGGGEMENKRQTNTSTTTEAKFCFLPLVFIYFKKLFMLFLCVFRVFLCENCCLS